MHKYRNIKSLQEHYLLLEKDNRSIITGKLGLPPEVADWAHGLSDKHDIWIANSLKAKVMSDNNLTTPDAGFPAKLKTGINKYTSDYMYILDWLKNPVRNQIENVNIKTLTFDQALDAAKKWHDSLSATGGRVEDKDGEVFLTYPDGFYWIDTKTNYCEAESKAMGHCGTAIYNTNVLLSLRDGNKEPHVTVDFDPHDGTIYQMKGKENKKPVEKYYKYIVDLLTLKEDHPYRVNGFATFGDGDFDISDLSKKEIESIFKKNEPLKISILDDPAKCLHLYDNELISKETVTSQMGKHVSGLSLGDDYCIIVDHLRDEDTEDLLEDLKPNDDAYDEFMEYNTPDDIEIFYNALSYKNIDKINDILVQENDLDPDELDDMVEEEWVNTINEYLDSDIYLEIRSIYLDMAQKNTYNSMMEDVFYSLNTYISLGVRVRATEPLFTPQDSVNFNGMKIPFESIYTLVFDDISESGETALTWKNLVVWFINAIKRYNNIVSIDYSTFVEPKSNEYNEKVAEFLEEQYPEEEKNNEDDNE